MAEWRFGMGWAEAGLEARLKGLANLEVNFPASGPGSPTDFASWNRYYSEVVVGKENPGPPVPNGVLLNLWQHVQQYGFSDPKIVTAHFDPKSQLLGRKLLLEIKVLGLRYLCGVRVAAVHENDGPETCVRGFRYDTLQGHIEEGSEWFVLSKNVATGEISFRIQASWRTGTFPNWWSRVGFEVLGRTYQLAWHRLAHQRLRVLSGEDAGLFEPVPRGRSLVHSGPDVFAADTWALNAPTAALRVAGSVAPDGAESQAKSDH